MPKKDQEKECGAKVGSRCRRHAPRPVIIDRGNQPNAMIIMYPEANCPCGDWLDEPIGPKASKKKDNDAKDNDTQ